MSKTCPNCGETFLHKSVSNVGRFQLNDMSGMDHLCFYVDTYDSELKVYFHTEDSE